ncbi:DMT family transporter [Paenibacillus shunpengii]|uniref:DMT family transporter n=1 Tax=Paenibacillus shunpengii TaxID=2054424 RepID=A0ABW5SM45_9BACL
MNHGVNIYKNSIANNISAIWKPILIIHLILEIIETIFPKKKKAGAESKKESVTEEISVVLIISFDLLIKSVKELGVGTSYAVFSGIGVFGMVVVDFALFQETISLLKEIIELGIFDSSRLN